MPLYAVIGLDHPPHSMAKRNSVRQEHRQFVIDNDEVVSLTGPFLDEQGNQCGSFYIFEAENEQEVRDWLDREPFVAAGVYKELIIRRFQVGMNRLPSRAWPDALLAGKKK